MATLGKKQSALRLSVTLRSLSLSGAGPHESSPIDLGSSNLLWWGTVQKSELTAEPPGGGTAVWWPTVPEATEIWKYWQGLFWPSMIRKSLLSDKRSLRPDWSWIEILGINQCSSYTNTNLETQQDTAISLVLQLSDHCPWLKRSSWKWIQLSRSMYYISTGLWFFKTTTFQE